MSTKIAVGTGMEVERETAMGTATEVGMGTDTKIKILNRYRRKSHVSKGP